MLDHVLQAVDTVVTPGRFGPVSGEDLCQTEREDAVTGLQPLLEEFTYIQKKNWNPKLQILRGLKSQFHITPQSKSKVMLILVA